MINLNCSDSMLTCKILSSDENRRLLLHAAKHKHDPMMMTVSKQAFDLLLTELDVRRPNKQNYCILLNLHANPMLS